MTTFAEAIKNTYWNHKGRHQAASTELAKLIPSEGAVDHPRGKNRALDKFRRASNCYYDLYNNGLINRGAEFRGVFNIRTSQYRTGNSYGFRTQMYTITEAAMDEIIQAAAAEQGLGHLLAAGSCCCTVT